MAPRLIASVFFVFLSILAFADSLTGKVVKVVDGDTLYVLDANYQQHKIRLAGIDALERKQAYGLASRKHLASIVTGKQVTIEYQKRDRYGRIVGKVWVNGVDACLKQVKAGFAWARFWVIIIAANRYKAPCFVRLQQPNNTLMSRV